MAVTIMFCTLKLPIDTFAKKYIIKLNKHTILLTIIFIKKCISSYID